MRKLVVAISLVLFSVVVNAQQIGMFAHSFYKPMIYNPALTGTSGFYNAMLVRRMQWTGFTGSPTLNTFNFDGNLKNKNVGIGVGLISDVRGISNRVGGNLYYSYRLKLNREFDLLFGVSFGVINQSLNFSKIIAETAVDPTLFADPQQQLTYDGNAGFALIWKDLEFGASVPQVVGNKVSFSADSTTATYLHDRHYIGYLKYRVSINEEKGIAIVPQTLFRVVPNAPLQFDATVNLDWNDKFWITATYKSNYAVAANIGMRIKKHFYVGYSYDFIIGGIGKHAGLSHEIMLNFKFGKDKTEEEPIVDEQPVVEEDVVIPEEPIEVEVVKAEVIDTVVSSPEDLPDLNTLLILNLLKEIEAMLDNPQATSRQVLDLKMRISAFSNSDFRDASIRGTVKSMTKKLKLPNQKSPDIIIKGTIVLNDTTVPPDFTFVSITIIDTDYDETVGTYTPNSKDGTFLLILRPQESYQLIIENDGYELFIEDLLFDKEAAENEIMKEVRLIKEGL